MKKLFYFLIIISGVLWCCGDGDSNAGVPDPDPDSPINVTLDISASDLTFEAIGGQIEFTIYCNSNWTITNNSSWCKTDVTNGNGDKTITVTVESYSEAEDQNTNLTIKAGNKTKVLTVTQKYVDAIILTKDKFDVQQEGGNFTVEVKSNIYYEIIIPSNFQTWIKQAVKSRALETKNFSFSISANENFDKREGYIVFNGYFLKDTVYVYQAQKDQLILTKDTYNIQARGEDITVELQTNTDYDVLIPSSARSWISQITTRSMRTDQLRFHIEANSSETNRSAKIVIKDKNSDLSDTVYINQTTPRTYIGDIILTTMEEVKAFQQAGYKKIVGNIIVQGKKITTLYYLNDQLEEIIGDLTIDCSTISDLRGLYGLKQIKGNLILKDAWLRSFEGLNNLEKIEGDFELNTSAADASLSITSFKGLDKLTTIGGSFKIIAFASKDDLSLDALTSFEGLENLEKIQGDFELNSTVNANSSSLTSLASFKGLNKLSTIGGSFKIISTAYYNANYSLNALASFEGLENLTNINGDFEIYSSTSSSLSLTSLTSFKGLNKLNNIGGNFKITAFNSLYFLASFEGLENLTNISGDFKINSSVSSLYSLTSFKGLSKLSNIGGNFSVDKYLSQENGLDNLVTVKGDMLLKLKSTLALNKLQYIHGTLSIMGEQNTIDLHLPNLNTINSNLFIISFNSIDIQNLKTVGNITISDCTSLYDFCNFKSILLNHQGNFRVENCGYNPTKYQILNGECSK